MPIPALRFLVGMAALGAAVPDFDAGAPTSADVIELRLTGLDGGALELDGGVPTDGSLRFELPSRIEDLQLRVLDPGSKLVPGRAQISIGRQTVIRFQAEPSLQPATLYRAVIEPDTGDQLTDANHRSLHVSELLFRTSGTPAPPRPSHAKHRPKRRRR